MGDDKFEYESLPIPSYEEAVSSRPGSSVSRPDPEGSDDAERQGLLQNGSATGPPHPRPRGYHPPTVESVRNSLDDLGSQGSRSARGSLEELQRELEQMDVEDPAQPQPGRRRLGNRFSKRLNDLTRTLSSLRLPLRRYLPTLPRCTINAGETRENVRFHGCMLLLRLFGLLLVVTIVYVFFFSDIFSLGGRLVIGQSYSAASVENFIQGHVNETNIADNLKKVTSYPHMAGTEGSYALAELVEQQFRNAVLDYVEMEEFEVYLNYPQKDGRRVAIVDPPDLAWEAVLEEKDERTQVFHGHSKSGNVTGNLVYANYGTHDDFKLLANRDISLNGTIALVRHFGAESDAAPKVKAAELAGAAGCIVYSDPGQDGSVKGQAYPDGRYMPDDGVQRGGVNLLSTVVGDVLSPGFASTPDEGTRLQPNESQSLPGIPSIPIAWRDAKRLLQALKGHGSKVPSEWVGGVPDVNQWWTGDGTSPLVNLMNLQDEVERQPIYNVIGRIIGLEQPDKRIIVGNHRDSWCLGSAGPGSGTAVFLEVVRIYGELLTYGWRPLRTIEFVSFDAGEYNLIGSTEHVENNLDSVRYGAYAYTNVDVGVSGTEFQAAASPLFENVVHQVLGRISDPYANKTLKTLWEERESKLNGLGARSDYVAFQDIAGVSSIDFGFTGDAYPYHSCHENWDWMTRFGDPGFHYHKVLGQFWALLIRELADSPLMPFDAEAYAAYVTTYITDLEKYAKSKNVPVVREPADANRTQGVSVNIQPLFDAAKTLRENAAQLDGWSQIWHDSVFGSGGYENNIMALQRTNYNSHVAGFDTHLLDLEEGGGVSPILPAVTWEPANAMIDPQPHPVQARHLWTAGVVRRRRGLFPCHP